MPCQTCQGTGAWFFERVTKNPDGKFIRFVAPQICTCDAGKRLFMTMAQELPTPQTPQETPP